MTIRRSHLLAAFLFAAFGPSAHADKAATGSKAPVVAQKKLSPTQYAEILIRDQKQLMKTLRKMEHAVVSLGGARIKEEDPVYTTAEQIGYLLAVHEVAGRTGGGPGIMKGVPAGSKKAIAAFGIKGKGGKTQGINIQLPFEQALNPVIDISDTAVEFPYRKLALYKKARGYLSFPGGYGTMDELFQFWGEKVASKSAVPLVAVDSKFWGPFFARLKRVSAEHGDLISKAEWQEITTLSDPMKIVKTMLASKAHEGIPSEAVQERNAQSLREGMKIIEEMPSSVAFVGSGGQRYAGVVASAAKAITDEQSTIRVGSTGDITDAVLSGAKDGSVYGFVRQGDPKAPQGLNVVHTTQDSTVHDVVLTSSLDGLVATPGGLHTLRTVFSVLTQIQTGKIPRVPVVLIGTHFWKPIFAMVEKIMLTETRQLIKPSDLGLFTITDDKSVAAEVFRNFKRGT